MIRGAKYNLSSVRLYLLAATIRNLVMGGMLVLYPEKFTSSAFHTMFQIAGPELWGFCFLAAAAVLILALWLRDSTRARIGLIVGAAIMVTIGTSAVVNLFNGGDSGGLFGIIVFYIIAAKDFILVGSPFLSLDDTRRIDV